MAASPPPTPPNSAVKKGHDMFGCSLESPLLVDWLFLPQNFGPMVGTYEGLLWLCECRWGGDCTSRWWGHLTTICGHQSIFLPQVVGILKPSMTFVSLPSPPAGSLCSSSSPAYSTHPQLAPPHCSSLPLLPLAPREVVGTLKHSITYPLLPLASNSLPLLSLTPGSPLTPCPHTGGGDPRT